MFLIILTRIWLEESTKDLSFEYFLANDNLDKKKTEIMNQIIDSYQEEDTSYFIGYQPNYPNLFRHIQGQFEEDAIFFVSDDLRAYSLTHLDLEKDNQYILFDY